MKRFKVGDMAKLISAGETVVLRPYIGTVVEITSIDARCYCIFCLIENRGKPTIADYRIRVCDGAGECIVYDPQLAPISDPDAGIKQEESEELEA